MQKIFMKLLLTSSLLLAGCSGNSARQPVRFQPTPAGETAPTVIRLRNTLKTATDPAALIRKFFDNHKGKLPIISGNSVTFVYHGKKGIPVSVVGDFNNWHRLKDIMIEISNTGVHYLSLKMPHAKTEGVHYMLARNCRRMQDFINDPANPIISFKKASYASWAVPPGYRGGRHIIIHEAFPSTQHKVKPKRVVAWLPASYWTNREKRYPVLYMHDEQNIWSGKSMAHGGWQVENTVTRLTEEGTIRECIIVGLPHSGKTRIPEYSPPFILDEKVYGKGAPGWGNQYLSYLLAIKKHIDKNYRTLPDRKNTVIAGSSMGGLISWYISWMRPDIFGTAGCFSPWFIFRYKDLDGGSVDFGRLISRGPKTAVRYYLDCGDSGWAKDGISGTLIARDALLKAGWRLGKDLKFVLEKGAIHNERAWAGRFPEFLKWALPR